MVAGESAGGNLAAAVSLRLRDDRATPGPAGQILIYPVLDAHGSAHASRKEFSGLIVSEKASEFFWTSYAGERDIERDPFAAPLHATTLTDLPPALVVLGGCDVLRDEGRVYTQRLEEAGVDTTEVCYPGQPHGFVNFGFPAATDAFEMIGRWAREHLVRDVVVRRIQRNRRTNCSNWVRRVSSSKSETIGCITAPLIAAMNIAVWRWLSPPVVGPIRMSVMRSTTSR